MSLPARLNSVALEIEGYALPGSQLKPWAHAHGVDPASATSVRASSADTNDGCRVQIGDAEAVASILLNGEERARSREASFVFGRVQHETTG